MSGFCTVLDAVESYIRVIHRSRASKEFSVKG